MAKYYSTTYHDTLKPNLKTSARKQPHVKNIAKNLANYFSMTHRGSL